jgi:hypothetical protein
LAAATAPSAKLNEKRTSLKIVMSWGGLYGALGSGVLPRWKDPNAVGRERRLRPCKHQLKQEPLLFLGFGLSGPKQGLIGILPELIGLLTLPPSLTMTRLLNRGACTYLTVEVCIEVLTPQNKA